MTPQPITIHGKSGTVMYLNDLWHPVSANEATMARVLFDDDSTGFFFVTPKDNQPGLGGITRKFDETQHPRGEDGRFIEASQPRIFNRPSEVAEVKGWPGDPVRFGWKDPKTGETTGRMLTGEPIPREQIPPKLYHVTTNAPAVESSGVLLGQRGDTGLGGGQAEGVSLTSSLEDAVVIQRELRRAVRIARGEVTIDDLEQFAREDEKEAGLPEGTLKNAVGFGRQQWDGSAFTLDKTFVWDEKLPEDKRGYVGPPHPPEERERLRRSLMKDAFNAYLQLRGHSDLPLLKNPLLFGRQEHLAKLNPEHVRTLEVEAEDIPAEALVTTGSDKFLHEVRVYADVPRRRRKLSIDLHSIAKYDENQARHPEGSSEGGQFAETGRSGKPEPSLYMKQSAATGIAQVEKFLPEAVKTARYKYVRTLWSDLNEAAREKVFQQYVREQYEFTDDALYTDEIDDKFRNDLQNDPVRQEQLTKDTEKQFRFFMKDQADPASISRDMKTLKHKDGTDFTLDEKAHAAVVWHAAYTNLEQDALIEYKNSDEYFQKRKAEVMQSLREQWAGTSHEAKGTLATELRIRGELPGVVAEMHEPLTWVTGVEKGDHNDNNYALTHAIAARLTELRFDELREERGLLKPKEKPAYTIEESNRSYEGHRDYLIKDASGEVIGASNTLEQATINAEEWQQRQRTQSSTDIIQTTWQAWKQSSSHGLGLSLQLAAAREFGGHHRMTRDEVNQALQDAEDVGGIETLQAYVRAQWEVTQLVMKKAGEDKLSVYRGLMLDGDRVKETTNLFVDAKGNPIPAPTNITNVDHGTPAYKIRSSVRQDRKILYYIDDPESVGPYTGPYLDTKEEAKAWAEAQMKKPGKFVSFDFNGEHFVVERNHVPVTDLRDLAEQVRTNPKTWYDVGQDVKDQVRAQWKKVWDENKAATSDLTPEKSDKLQETLFQKLGDEGRFQLMQSYAQQGYITLPKPKTFPLETNEAAIHRRLQTYVGIASRQGKVFTKLPDIALQRAGAQSTTGTAIVANEWNGVGDLPPNPTRVVLRVEAPATSVLSLPVYGQNSQEEHETVLMGTRDKWLWDAWAGRAPLFDNITITGKPVPTNLTMNWGDSVQKAEKLTLDLQEEDRGKPHWMSSTNFSTVLKWEESQHPRDKEGKFTESGTVSTAQPDAGAGSGGGDAVPSSPSKGQARPTAAPEALAVANAYNAKHGFPPLQHGYVTVDERRAKAIAHAYEAMPVDDSANPAVKDAYEALSTEIQAQWDHITASGVQMIPWTKDGQPYQNSQEMVADVQNNKRLYFFTGGDPHPLLGAIDPTTGLSMNDKFRAVHDYFGHAAGGYGFGARGEENAWLSHSQMLSPKARRALTTETRGQNSWVNFGAQNYHPDGTYKHIPPGNRPFAAQKVALLPDRYVFP